MLEIRNLTAGYGKLLILHDLHLDVPAGQFVAILGPNGSGKSTLLKTIFGLTDVSAGTVAWRGQALLGQPTQRLNQLGLAYVPQRENVFRSLTVRDNLLLAVRRPGRRGAGRGEPDGASSLDGKGGGAGWGEPDGKGGGARPPGATLEECLARFPILRKRQAQPAGQLSGGERQLLAIALGWLAHPTLMLLDEPSAGLSPLFVTEVFQTLKTLCAGGITLVVVEQNARSILRWCDAAVVLREGQVVFQGTADAVLADAATVDSYLGVGARRPAP